MADPTISHGWVTAEPDAGFDVDAPNLNDHHITGFGAAVSAIVDPAITTHAGATDPHGDRAFASAAVAALSTVYQPLDSDLTAIAALSTTSYGRAFLALADAAAGRTALGLGTAATQSSGAFDAAGAAAAAQAASQPLDSDLTAIAALTTTSFGRALLALADAAAARTALGLGTAALSAAGDFDAAGAAAAAQAASQPLDSDLTAIAALTTTTYGRALLALADAAAGRSALALVIGTDVQGYDADLTAIAGLTSAADKLPYFTGSAAAALADLTTFARSLLDDANAGAARTTLGLGTAAVAATGDFDAAGAAAAAQAASQPLDSDLTTIGAIAPANDDIIQRKAGAWTNRTIAQLMTDLGIAGSYQPLDSDLTAIAALTTTSFGRSVLDRADAAALRTLAGLGTLATQSGTFSGTSSGTNTGDQTLPTRASLGLATSDTPQFTGIEVGAASDTTLARASAGDLSVEGNRIFRVGGAAVPVADGGTGSGTASGARTNLGLVISTDVAAAVHAATHKSGGSDAVKIDELAAPTDVTTLDASTSAHGLLKKLPGGTTTFLRGDGAFATPAGIASGTSFPGSPSDGDLFYRTDRAYLYRYHSSGTRWLTVHEYALPLFDVILQGGINATTEIARGFFDGTYDAFVTSVEFSSQVITTNSSTNVWTLKVSKYTPGSAETVIATRSTLGDGTSLWTPVTVAVNAVVDHTTHTMISFACVKGGTAGALYAHATIKYRLVG